MGELIWGLPRLSVLELKARLRPRLALANMPLHSENATAWWEARGRRLWLALRDELGLREGEGKRRRQLAED